MDVRRHTISDAQQQYPSYIKQARSNTVSGNPIAAAGLRPANSEWDQHVVLSPVYTAWEHCSSRGGGDRRAEQFSALQNRWASLNSLDDVSSPLIKPTKDGETSTDGVMRRIEKGIFSMRISNPSVGEAATFL